MRCESLETSETRVLVMVPRHKNITSCIAPHVFIERSMNRTVDPGVAYRRMVSSISGVEKTRLEEGVILHGSGS